jgi:hypothetical protein
MKMNRRLNLITATLASVLTITGARAEEKTPGFNQKIPEKIMTPDTVNTSIGTLKFVDGVPTAETTQKVYDNLDFLRGTEVFLNFIPATSSWRGRQRQHASRVRSPEKEEPRAIIQV